MIDIWRPIPGYESLYEASATGQIRRCSTGRILRPWGNGKAGARRQLNLTVDGLHHTWLVHRLVALTFIGPCPPGEEVNHKDGDPRNNEIKNLEYVTGLDNMRHAREHGLFPIPKGEKKAGAKLTDEAVRHIRASKDRTCNLARKFQVSWGAIAHVRKGRRWTHIT